MNRHLFFVVFGGLLIANFLNVAVLWNDGTAKRILDDSAASPLPSLLAILAFGVIVAYPVGRGACWIYRVRVENIE